MLVTGATDTMDLPMSGPVCPVCTTELDARVLGVSGESQLLQCPGCELQVWEPRSHPGEAYYDNDPHYLAEPYVDWLGWHHSIAVKMLPRSVSTVLDVGCSDGRFIYAVAARGVKAVGIDISQRLVTLGNQRHGGDLLRCVALDAYIESVKVPVDALTLFEVVEHVEDPLAFLRTALRALKIGGTVMISTPNRDGYPKPEAGYDEPPHHLTRWNTRALTALATAAGLEVSRVEICPAEIAIKAFLLSRFRFGVVVALLRRSARRARERGSQDLAIEQRVPVRSAILVKDRLAEAIARVTAPLLRPFFPGPAMILIATKRAT